MAVLDEAKEVDRLAERAYVAYRAQRELVEGARLTTWALLCEQKKDRFRAIARFQRLDILAIHASYSKLG